MVQVLLVSDDQQAIAELQSGFAEVQPCSCVVAPDPRTALGWLRKQDAPPAFSPVLCLLDLDPQSGMALDLLRVCKSDPDLQLLPIIGFCDPGLLALVGAAYELGANCCVPRHGLRSAARAAARFWLGAAALPAIGRASRAL